MLQALDIFLSIAGFSLLAILAVCAIFMTFYLYDIRQELKRARIRTIKLLYPEEEEEQHIIEPQEPEGDPWYVRKLN